jgi:small-conductance mechanosensitive channel
MSTSDKILAENSDATLTINNDTVAELSNQLPSFVDLLPEQAKPYWQLVQAYPIIEALVVFAIFWCLALFIRRYAITFIDRIADKTNSTLDDNIIESLKAPVYSIVLWFGLIVASKSAGFVTGAAAYITPIALTMIALALLRGALSVSSMLIIAMSRDTVRFKKMDIRTEPLLVITSKIILMIMGAYAILMIWGINPVGLLASAGIVGIAVGFAAKDTLANLFSGVFILADRPYKLGDYVNLDSGERGKVTHIGIRSTRLLTRDDIEITIPNGLIGNEKIVNESGGSYHKMRIRVNVQCAYSSDLEKVESVLMDVAASQPQICQYPNARVRFRGFGDSGIDVQLMGWIEEPEDRGSTTHLLIKAIHKAFNQNDIEIPYPHLTLLKPGVAE